MPIKTTIQSVIVFYLIWICGPLLSPPSHMQAHMNIVMGAEEKKNPQVDHDL